MLINFTHLKVLLTKDILTLRRNIGFVVAFIVLPLGLMGAFIAIQDLVVKGTVEGSLMKDHFFYTSTSYFPVEPSSLNTTKVNYPYQDVQPFVFNASGGPPTVYASSFQSCAAKNQNKYFFDKVMVIAEDADVRAKAKTYIESYMLKVAGFPDGWSVQTFASQEEGFKEYQASDTTPYCFGFTFKTFDADNDDYEIEFHWAKDQVPDTNQPAYNDQIKSPDLLSWGQWKNTGATAIYPYMTEFIARWKASPQDFESITPLYNQEMGYSPLESTKFDNVSPLALTQLIQNFPFFFMIILLIPFYYIVSKVASEKESKSREGMKMMGLNDATYFLAWFIFYFMICVVTSALLSLMGIAIFRNVNIFIYFLWTLCYSLTLYGQAFTIVAFLPTKKSSSIAATLFHIVSYYLVFSIADPATPSSVQYGLSIFPNVCMGQCVKQIFFYNYNTRDGLNWSTLDKEYQNFSFRGGLAMMFFDLVFWAVLGLYLDQVVPSQFGVAKPWNFCCKSKKKVNPDDAKKRLIGNQEGRNFEAVSDALKKQEEREECLSVRDLVKQFGNKRAVDGTSLTMYNGQIFALLGHNGAGKTTTISMLTGLLEATEGSAFVNGVDIFNNMDEVRKTLGVCPQHDVLFESLTPVDHLRLFCSFKGTPADEVEDKVQKMLEDIELVTVKDQLSRTLSGGQKRKLSVAIALIGDSKVVLLDEPTSGMDTSARRRLWDMLKKNKQGRIIILTTHYMDEADILGDRIAIMAEGKVVCTGSSLFLKNRFGVGYNLVIAKKTRFPAPQVDKFIMDNISNVKKMQEVSSEISYQLPTSSSKQFKNFFQEFDKNLDQLGIRSYGVGITTLEEVFLKIGHGEELEESRRYSAKDHQEVVKSRRSGTGVQNESLATEMEEYSIANNKGSATFMSQFCVLLRKKILMQVRDRKTLAIDTIFPVLLIIVGLALSTISFFVNGPIRAMTPSLYTDNLQMIWNENSAYHTTESKVIETFMINNWQAMNTSQIDLVRGITIDSGDSAAPKPLFDVAGQLDTATYNWVNVEEPRHTPFFGQFYVNSLNDSVPRNSPFGPIPNLENAYSGVLLLNSTSQDIAAVFGGQAHTAFLRHWLGIPAGAKFNLKFDARPFPISKALESLNKTIAGTNAAILMAIAWLMISDSLLQSIIKERSKQIKHQLLISGASLPAYWIGNYAADICFHAIAAIVGIIGVHAFGIDVQGVELLFLAVIFANPAFVYFFTFFFDKDESGSLVIKMFYFVFGMIAPIAVSVLLVIPSTTNVAQVLRWFFYPIPIFALTFGYMSIAQRSIIALVNGTDVAKSLSPEVAGIALAFLCCSIPFYWILVYAFENKWIDRLLCRGGKKNVDSDRKSLVRAQSIAGDQDQDINEERDRVRDLDPKNTPVRVSEVVKTYGGVRAVRSISFGLDYGECFALLGVSGAGKTSIFKCLTGEIYPTTGELTINGNDVTTAEGFQKARKQIGYCPQFDSIFEGLTVREHLDIYAALKGIKIDLQKPLVEQAIEDMDLKSYVNIHANNLSGGNKRKLSVAMAMLGNPPLVFLDEPSTGVDPQAKRFMWNIVSKISTQRKKSAVIITTHSMEEAEALCTKMGIMVDGRFKCFGSSQHIKDKFGTGYELEFKIRTLTEHEVADILTQAGLKDKEKLTKEEATRLCNSTGESDLMSDMQVDGLGSEYAAAFKISQSVDATEFVKWQFTEGHGNKALDLLEPKFKEFHIIEHYGSSWKLKVSRDNYSIGFLFGMMEDIQAEFNISEYSVAQTTLEQIFNTFALTAEGSRNDIRKSSTIRRQSSKGKSTGGM